MSIVHTDLLNPEYVHWKKFLADAENWSSDEIHAYQLSEVQRIVWYAYEHVVAYRELYDAAGITPDLIGTLEDLRKVPFLEKEMIRDNVEDFSANVEGRYQVTTGGSTGVPCGMYRDPIAFAKELASKAYQYHRVGWEEGDRQLILRGLRISTEDHMKYLPDFEELRCSTYHLVPEWMERYRQRALDYKPEWIRCFPSSGYVFARFLEETGRYFPPIRGILCASEHLYDFQKNLLSKVFGARVFSHYGHYEMAALAGFCEYEDTYHVLPQYGYVELIGKDGKPITESGQIGEVVATSFIMHATPFVRYRTQDLALLKGWSCSSCQRPYQVWERVEGRLQELMVTATGRYISTSMLNMHDETYEHINKFQFRQKEPGKITFRFVPKDSCSEWVVQDMQARFLMKLGNDVELQMEKVEDIPLTSRGKHRLLVQEMKLKYDNQSLDVPLRL